jgi:DNA (cytosine-5)-methyltransferase 1
MAPINMINSFLNGYMSYTTNSYNVAFGIQRLYYKIGKVCSLDYTIQGTYTINSKENLFSLFEQGYVWNKIKSVVSENIDSQDVYNFEVENDNSYCVENQIVHNCQPFSIAGHQKGFEDERSNVFWKILKIIDHHQPKCVILENVKNLVTHDDGNTFKVIKTNLESRGYNIRHKVLNTSDITGVPQHRERIYIVCLKSKEVFDNFNLDFPKIEKKKINEILENEILEKYYYRDKSSAWNLLREAVIKKDTIYQYRRVYVRENKSSECPTLTANMGSGGHNVPIILDDNGIRKLTPRECFNFQGFPSIYKFPEMSDCNLYKLAGNAVSVSVVKLIADRLVPLLVSELN